MLPGTMRIPLIFTSHIACIHADTRRVSRDGCRLVRRCDARGAVAVARAAAQDAPGGAQTCIGEVLGGGVRARIRQGLPPSLPSRPGGREQAGRGGCPLSKAARVPASRTCLAALSAKSAQQDWRRHVCFPCKHHPAPSFRLIDHRIQLFSVQSINLRPDLCAALARVRSQLPANIACSLRVPDAPPYVRSSVVESSVTSSACWYFGSLWVEGMNYTGSSKSRMMTVESGRVEPGQDL